MNVVLWPHALYHPHHCSCAPHGSLICATVVMCHFFPHQHFCSVEVEIKHYPPRIAEFVVVFWRLWVLRRNRNRVIQEGRGDAFPEGLQCVANVLDSSERRDVTSYEAAILRLNGNGGLGEIVQAIESALFAPAGRNSLL